MKVNNSPAGESCWLSEASDQAGPPPPRQRYKLGMKQERMPRPSTLGAGFCAPAETQKTLGTILALLTPCQACNQVPLRRQKAGEYSGADANIRVGSGLECDLGFLKVSLNHFEGWVLGPCWCTPYRTLSTARDCWVPHHHHCDLGRVVHLFKAELRENSAHTLDQLNSDCTKWN